MGNAQRTRSAPHGVEVPLFFLPLRAADEHQPPVRDVGQLRKRLQQGRVALPRFHAADVRDQNGVRRDAELAAHVRTVGRRPVRPRAFNGIEDDLALRPWIPVAKR